MFIAQEKQAMNLEHGAIYNFREHQRVMSYGGGRFEADDVTILICEITNNEITNNKFNMFDWIFYLIFHF